MPRPLVVGNGNILAALDANLAIREFTFPYVGQQNHLFGNSIRIGLWVGGQFRWLDDGGWQRSLRYENDTLATNAVCMHDELSVTLTLSDCVLHDRNILLRRFRVTNHRDETREMRLFLNSDFNLNESDIGDTALYEPSLDAMIHYKRDVYFLIGGASGVEGIFQYTTGVKGFHGAEGTWRDAEDGWLSMNPVEQGSVDSTVSFRAEVGALSTTEIQSWICVGHTFGEVSGLLSGLKTDGFESAREETCAHWHRWPGERVTAIRLNVREESSRETAQQRDCNRTKSRAFVGALLAAPSSLRGGDYLQTQSESATAPIEEETQESGDPLASLPTRVAEVFRRSLLVIRTQIDNRGAVIAANDSDILETARAHYSYMWSRDGALVTNALDQLDCQEITQRFFDLSRRLLPCERPMLLHKYDPAGTVGATWHPHIIDGKHDQPFQQDSTALVLWSLGQHCRRYGESAFTSRMYHELVVPAADFMLGYRDKNTGLPLPSYDLWEERRGVHAYTCGTVYGAFIASAEMAQIFGDCDRAAQYVAAAEKLHAGIDGYLWDEEAHRYARRVIFHADGRIERDMTIDSALYGLFAFGAVPPAASRMRSTMQQVQERLSVRTEIGGIARYENDYYFRRSDDIERVPGNPWIICTLWIAQYHLALSQALSNPVCSEYCLAEGIASRTAALTLLRWAAAQATESGILPEQIHPYTGEHLSVSPLTWSHAEFIRTTLLLLETPCIGR